MPVDAAPTTKPIAVVSRWSAHPRLALFAISFVILFLELACIRWFGSTVVFLTFFTNIVLLACVLGMSAGCLAAARRGDYLETVIPLLVLAVVLAQGMLWGYQRDRVAVSVGDNQGSPQQVYFGTETPGRGVFGSRVPIEFIAAGFYGLLALVFVGLGQVMGRAFDAIPNRISAYTTNIAGSLAGIAAFSAVSYARMPPVVWFAVALVPALAFLRRLVWLQAIGLASLLALLTWVPTPDLNTEERVVWSPYYKVLYLPELGGIFTNNIGHQVMVPLDVKGSAYALPYLLNRDSSGPPRRDVLIIGAGSGNDVQAALAQGARHVDAVEIDPLLYELGRADHPDRPYQDARVAVHIEDGRGFLRSTRTTYDQVVFALVDSLVLHSAYSSLRLESFLFTEEAFQDVRQHLRESGVLVVGNYFRQGFVIGRLVAMAERVFGTRPIVLSIPYQPRITENQDQRGAFSLMIVGRTEAAVAPIRRQFEQGKWFWMNASPPKHARLNGFGPEPPEPPSPLELPWLKLGPSEVDTTLIKRLATDDWPFLYLRSPAIPAFNLRGVAFMLGISVVILGVCARLGTGRPNGQMFFLGAAFMLLETRGVVELALLFGSTWKVSAIVFAAILVMILLSNLYVLAAPPRGTRLFYGLLLAALVVDYLMPARGFLGLPELVRAPAACAVVFAPIFFAGVVFATVFRTSRRPDVDLGWNIAGVVLGGLSEYLSLVTGLSGLLLIAGVFYVLSAVLALRAPAPLSPS
jgi:SAM-dependent methyltransferase